MNRSWRRGNVTYQRCKKKLFANTMKKLMIALILKHPKEKAEFQAHAESKGESLNGFIDCATDETLARD